MDCFDDYSLKGPFEMFPVFLCGFGRLHPNLVGLGKHGDFEAGRFDRSREEDFKEEGTEIDFEVFVRVENIHFKFERIPKGRGEERTEIKT